MGYSKFAAHIEWVIPAKWNVRAVSGLPFEDSTNTGTGININTSSMRKVVYRNERREREQRLKGIVRTPKENSAYQALQMDSALA